MPWRRPGSLRLVVDRLDAAAEVLRLTPQGLFTELHEGERLSDVAEAQGKELEAVQEGGRGARVEAVRGPSSRPWRTGI
jgi:hypothetical protein